MSGERCCDTLSLWMVRSLANGQILSLFQINRALVRLCFQVFYACNVPVCSQNRPQPVRTIPADGSVRRSPSATVTEGCQPSSARMRVGSIASRASTATSRITRHEHRSSLSCCPARAGKGALIMQPPVTCGADDFRSHEPHGPITSRSKAVAGLVSVPLSR